VIDGMPAGVPIGIDEVQHQLDRRRPGQSVLSTQRAESDRVEILSGIFEGRTTGASIGFVVRNNDARSSDYSEMRTMFRPSHADYTYNAKYGFRDYRGGGRSSARETIARVVAGAFAMQALRHIGINVWAYTSQVGNIAVPHPYTSYSPDMVDRNDVRCPDGEVAEKMQRLILKAKNDGDTVGGVVTGVITGCPAGIGEPVMDKLQARLAAAMMSINAAKGFDYGMGFDGSASFGSEVVDVFVPDGTGGGTTLTNHSGGIQGGITNGSDIYFRVAFKPVATMSRPLRTVDVNGNEAILKARGRHDPCVLPRAVPVVEAMAAVTILDMWLLARAQAPLM
jgi:chorismate synthase